VKRDKRQGDFKRPSIGKRRCAEGFKQVAARIERESLMRRPFVGGLAAAPEQLGLNEGEAPPREVDGAQVDLCACKCFVEFGSIRVVAPVKATEERGGKHAPHLLGAGSHALFLVAAERLPAAFRVERVVITLTWVVGSIRAFQGNTKKVRLCPCQS